MKSRQVKTIFISNELAQRTAELLNSFASRRPSEGVVYWFGIESANFAVVTTLIVPDAETGAGSVRTSPEANAEAIDVITGTQLVYIGQAHSHAGPNVCHSQVDDEETFASFDGVISLVIPWFGRYGFQVEHCGVYRHMGGRFRLIQDVGEHLQILPGIADLRVGHRL